MQFSVVLMLSCGIIGLLATIVWIIVDLVRRDKRKEKIARKAVANISGQPLKKTFEPYVSTQMTEALLTDIHSSFTVGISGMQGSVETEGLGNTASIKFTQGLDEGTEKLRIQETEMAKGLEKTEAIYETVGLGKTEALEETEALEKTMGSGKTVAIDNTIGSEKTTALDFEMTAVLDETAGLERTEALDETEGSNKTEALKGTMAFDKTEGLKVSESSEPRKAKFCINCGTSLTGSGRFCSKCGFKNN